MSEKLEELISLLYQDKLTQYGKRLLVENIEKLQKENEELRAKWDKDTHILQNKLDYANADRIDLTQQNKELRKENEELKSNSNDSVVAIKLYSLQKDNEQLRTEVNSLKEENEELKADNYELDNRITDLLENIPKSKLKDIIDRIDYDIKKTKEIISKNTNIYASYRKNDYQIVRLKAMNTKSLDIKKRLQELLDGSDIDVGSIESEE